MLVYLPILVINGFGGRAEMDTIIVWFLWIELNRQAAEPIWYVVGTSKPR